MISMNFEINEIMYLYTMTNIQKILRKNLIW